MTGLKGGTGSWDVGDDLFRKGYPVVPVVLPRFFPDSSNPILQGRFEMSRSESKRWNGWFLTAVCALFALAAVYLLNSDNRSKSSSGTEHSPNAPSVVASPTPEPPPPIPSPRQTPPSDNGLASVSGTVRFADSNEPVSGTLIQLACTTFSLTTHSDQCGSYTLTNLPPQTGLWITAEDRMSDLYMYNTSVSLFLETGEEKRMDLTVYKGCKGSISGKVVGEKVYFDSAQEGPTTRSIVEQFQRKEEIPVAGITVRLSLCSSEDDTDPGTETLTDEGGDFRFLNLRPASYHIAPVSLPETFFDNVSPIHIELKSEQVADATMKFEMEAVSISGRVTDNRGNPVAGVEVFEDEQFEYNYFKDEYEPRTRTKTDMDGRYRLTHLHPAGFETAAQYFANGNYTDDEYLVVLGRGEALRKIPAITENSLKEGMKFLEASAKKANRLGGVPPLTEKPGEKLPQSEGSTITGVDFVLQANGSISGSIVGSGEKAIQALEFPPKEITLASSPRRPPLEAWPSGLQFSKPTYYSSSIAPEGQFEFLSVQPGKYSIFVDDINRVRLQTDPTTVTVGDGERIENLRLTIDSEKNSASLEFAVLDALTRTPPEAFTCTLEYKNQNISVSPVNADGEYMLPEKTGETVRFENLPVGQAKILINVVGVGQKYLRMSLDVELKPGKTTLDTILLTPYGKLVGQVQESDTGKVIPDFSAHLIQTEKPLSFLNTPSIRRSIPGPGRFEAQLPPGENIVEVLSEGYGPQILKVQIEPGETIERTIRMKPAGRLVGQITCGGQPAESYSVSTWALNATPNFEDSTPWNSYEKLVGRPGEKKDGGFYECVNLGEDEQNVVAEYSYLDTAGIRYTISQYDSVRVRPGEELRKDFRFDENCGIAGAIECPFWTKKVIVEVFNDQPDPFKPDVTRVAARLETRLNNSTYQIRYLSPGTYTVTTTYKDERYETHSLPPKTLTLQPGRIETVDIAN